LALRRRVPPWRKWERYKEYPGACPVPLMPEKIRRSDHGVAGPDPSRVPPQNRRRTPPRTSRGVPMVSSPLDARPTSISLSNTFSAAG